MASFDTAANPPHAAHVMVDESGSSIAGCGAVILVVIGALWLIALSNGAVVWTIILAIVLLIGLAVFVSGVLEMRRWENLELHFAEWPLTIGSTTAVRVTRRSKRPVPDAEYELTAEITCTESATYMDGTDQRTATDEVFEEDITVKGVLENQVFEALVNLHIPADRGAPTMDLGNNTVEWELDIDVDELSRIMAKMAFTLEVAPVLDPRLRNVQDTLAGDA